MLEWSMANINAVGFESDDGEYQIITFNWTRQTKTWSRDCARIVNQCANSTESFIGINILCIIIIIVIVERQRTISYRANFVFNRIRRGFQCSFHFSAGSLTNFTYRIAVDTNLDMLVCGNIPVQRETIFPFILWPPFMSAISADRRRSTFVQWK